jgi:hypothetical protein
MTVFHIEINSILSIGSLRNVPQLEVDLPLYRSQRNPKNGAAPRKSQEAEKGHRYDINTDCTPADQMIKFSTPTPTLVVCTFFRGHSNLISLPSPQRIRSYKSSTPFASTAYTNDTRGNHILDRVRSFHSERCPSEEYIQDGGPMNGVPPLLHNLRRSVWMFQTKILPASFCAALMKQSFHFQNCQTPLFFSFPDIRPPKPRS